MADVKWINGVTVPAFEKTIKKTLADGSTVERVLKVDPKAWDRKGLLAFFEKACRIWTDQVGAKDLTADEFHKALNRVDDQLAGKIERHAGGGPRLDPVFRFIRDRAASELGVSPTTILDLAQIEKAMGPEFIAKAKADRKAMLLKEIEALG